MSPLEFYSKLFSVLNVKVTNGVKAPHKAIMLFSIIELFEYDYLKSNIIPFDDVIDKTFKKNWNRYVIGKEKFNHFSPNTWTPFWHLKKEAFWHLVPLPGFTIVDIESLSPTKTPSRSQMMSKIKHVKLDDNLYMLLKDTYSRELLKRVLLETYT